MQPARYLPLARTGHWRLCLQTPRPSQCPTRRTAPGPMSVRQSARTGTGWSILGDKPPRCSGTPLCRHSENSEHALAGAPKHGGARRVVGCVRPVVHVEVRDLEPLDARHAADVRPRHFWVRAGGLSGALEQLYLFPTRSRGSLRAAPFYNRKRERL